MKIPPHPLGYKEPFSGSVSDYYNILEAAMTYAVDFRRGK